VRLQIRSPGEKSIAAKLQTRRGPRRVVGTVALCLAVVLVFSLGLTATATQAIIQPSGPSHNRTLSGGTGLGISGHGGIKCESTEGTGEVTGPKGGTLTVTFRGCKYQGGGPERSCGNIGPGAIETKPLVTELGWISQARQEVGEDYKPATGVVAAQFECEGLHIVVKGSVIGVVKRLDAMTEEQEVELAVGGFQGTTQVPEKLESMPPDVLRSELQGFLGEFEAGLALTWVIKSQPLMVQPKGATRTNHARHRVVPDPTEVRAVGASDPEHGRCQKRRGGRFTNAACTSLAGAAMAKKKGKYEWHPL
jgi:hypothetical protein